MKRASIVLLLILFFIPSIAMANAIQYANNAYVTPAGWTQIASTPASGGLDHYEYYHWTLADLGYTPNGANIVFHSIYNWASEINQLAVYINDASASSSAGWDSHGDNQSTTSPNWSTWSLQGIWSDPTGSASTKYDVVYTLSPADLSLMANGGKFEIGIDPDCHYYLTGITLDVSQPIPEPATGLLLGLGLLGMIGYGWRRNK